MEELDFDQDKIDEVVAWEEEKTRNAVRGFAQGVFGDDADSETEEGTETEETDARSGSPAVEPDAGIAAA
jgi:hypothetical protein